ncbi:MAG: hypothetical protein HY681_03485 [Chloroflexi bacterium]|nr:hypothetical protein [Chloroflexota bacterium]
MLASRLMVTPVLFIGILLAGCGIDVVGSECSPQVKEAPCAVGVKAGKAYPYTLYTHCGILWAYFDERWWEASPHLGDGSGNPPSGWGNPFDRGTMEMVGEGGARFISGMGQTAEFKPLPIEVQEYPGVGCD